MTVYGVGKEFNEKKFIGLSEDIKPIGAGAGSKFLEFDTKDIYIFSGSTWLFYSNDTTDFDGGEF